MRKLNILIFNWRDIGNPEAGGAERATHEIATRWVGAGHRVRVLSGRYQGCSSRQSIDGIDIFRVGNKHTLYASAASFYMKKLKGCSDIVIDEINTIPFFTPLYVQEPKIAILHQLAREVLFAELDPIRASLIWLSEPLFLRLYKRFPMITSESARRDLIRSGFSDDRIVTIKYGVNHETYRPGFHKSDRPNILYFGRLKRSKGLDLILFAFAHLLHDIPECMLTIVGTGENRYVNHLKGLSRTLGLEKNIEFVPLSFQDSPEEKIRHLQEAWVLVLASKREGFGLSVLEANACGTPAVVTNVPGLRDIVKNGETGLVVEHGDERALASALRSILEDNDLRVRVSAAARTWSLQFNWDLTSALILEVMREQLSNHTNM